MPNHFKDGKGIFQCIDGVAAMIYSLIKRKGCDNMNTNVSTGLSEAEARLGFYNHLARAAEDVRAGRVEELDAAFDDIRKKLNEFELPGKPKANRYK